MTGALPLHEQTLKLDGGLSARYRPSMGNALLVLAHGAGANLDHSHMQSIADALSAVGISTLRFNFPFMEAGKRRVDKLEVCLDTLRLALTAASELAPSDDLYLGGHSFGGRMASHLAAAEAPDIQGLVFFSFPLHVAKKPDTRRAEHLPDIKLPMLFLSGDRDDLADKPLLVGVTDTLPGATVHWLDTADHSFKILKRTRRADENVYDEAARETINWMNSL